MVAAWGLIAGLSWSEMMTLRPNLVCDLFFARREYDDEQHQLRRQKNDYDLNAEDLAMWDGE